MISGWWGQRGDASFVGGKFHDVGRHKCCVPRIADHRASGRPPPPSLRSGGGTPAERNPISAVLRIGLPSPPPRSSVIVPRWLATGDGGRETGDWWLTQFRGESGGSRGARFRIANFEFGTESQLQMRKLRNCKFEIPLGTGDLRYPRPTKVTPAQMTRTAIHRVGLIGSLKQTFDRIMTSTYPRLTVG